MVKRFGLRFFLLAYLSLVLGLFLTCYIFLAPGLGRGIELLHLLALLLLVSGLVMIHIIWPRAGKSVLNSQERRQQEVLDSMPDAMIVVNADGEILDWNIGAATLFGYGKHEVLGKPIFELFANHDPRLRSQLLTSKNGGKIDNLEVECIGKNDQRVDVLFRQVPFSNDVADSKQFIFWGRDITEYKRIQEQALQTEKLAATGRFAAEIAHQLNTPLGSILLSAQMLQDARLKEDEREDVEKIIRQVKHSKFVVKSLLDFSRNAAGQPESVDLNRLIHNTVELFRQSLRKRSIRIDCSFEPRPCKSVVFKNEIEQVVLNLLANAADAMPRGGTISVRTSLYLDRDFIIYFQDTGVGIPKEHRDKIFQPFFTTKAVGCGTGLGLPVCKRIIEHHHGSIAVTSEVGKGTLVVVKLPIQPLERKHERVQNSGGR